MIPTHFPHFHLLFPPLGGLLSSFPWSSLPFDERTFVKRCCPWLSLASGFRGTRRQVPSLSYTVMGERERERGVGALLRESQRTWVYSYYLSAIRDSFIAIVLISHTHKPGLPHHVAVLHTHTGTVTITCLWGLATWIERRGGKGKICFVLCVCVLHTGLLC